MKQYLSEKSAKLLVPEILQEFLETGVKCFQDVDEINDILLRYYGVHNRAEKFQFGNCNSEYPLFFSIKSDFKNQVEDYDEDIFSFFDASLPAEAKKNNRPIVVACFTETFPEFFMLDSEYCLLGYFHDVVEKYSFAPNQITLMMPDQNFKVSYHEWCHRNSLAPLIDVRSISYFEKETELRTNPRDVKKLLPVDDRAYDKPFFMLCARAHEHRIAVFHYLLENDLLHENFFYSFLSRDRFLKFQGFLDQCLWEEGKARRKKIENFLEQGPHFLDKIDPNLVDAETPSEFINKSAIQLVLETDFVSPNSLFLTEKSFKPLMYGQAFIIVGHPGSLDFLKKCGYRTFSDFWDESYDQIEDPRQRFMAIMGEVHRIIDLPVSRRIKLFSSLEFKETLKFNEKKFYERCLEYSS